MNQRQHFQSPFALDRGSLFLRLLVCSADSDAIRGIECIRTFNILRLSCLSSSSRPLLFFHFSIALAVFSFHPVTRQGIMRPEPRVFEILLSKMSRHSPFVLHYVFRWIISKRSKHFGNIVSLLINKCIIIISFCSIKIPRCWYWCRY